MPAPDAKDATDLALLEEKVREAGHIARRYFGGSFKHWDKSKGNPVSEADLEIDSFLHNQLRSSRPAYAWLSEETTDDRSRFDAESCFMVDPIDGTVAFLKGRPHFTICAAVVTHSRPVAGVVYNPITEECFTASRGGGAFLNGNAIRVSDRSDLAGCHMLGDKAMIASHYWNNPPNRPWPEMDIESRGSVAYRIALVAGGGFDAMLALSSKKDWDLAAADIILHEAGGLLTSHRGEVFLYNDRDARQLSAIAAGPLLHPEIVARVRHINLPRT